MKIQTVTPEADVGPFSPLQNMVWHTSSLSLWGKKRKLYLILACLVSSFQNLHECVIKKQTHPFSLCFTQRLSILLQADGVQAGWDMNAFPSPHYHFVAQNQT